MKTDIIISLLRSILYKLDNCISPDTPSNLEAYLNDNTLFIPSATLDGNTLNIVQVRLDGNTLYL